MKTHLAAWLMWLVSAYSATANEAGRKMLDEIMDKPGAWNQMCSIPEPMSFDAPVPIFSGSLISRYFHLGSREAGRLQASRNDVVPALIEVLHEMDLAKPPAETRGPEKGDFRQMRSGLKSNWLNPLHLQIIRELNAVEALPELLRLERQLRGQLDMAEKDVKSVLPPLPLDGFAFFEKPGDRKREGKWWESAEHKRDVEIFTCRVFQRELLGTMTVLLKNEVFDPAKAKIEHLRQPEFEKRLKKARQKVSDAKEDLAKKEANHDAKGTKEARAAVAEFEQELGWLESVSGDVSFEADYTPALREEIRTLSESFLKSVPAEKRRGAAAMPSHKEEK